MVQAARLVRRNHAAARMTLAASAFCEGRCLDGLVRNLTARGAMFESVHHLAVGAKVCLDIQGLGLAQASVAWSIGPRAGLGFDGPLSAHGIEQQAEPAARTMP